MSRDATSFCARLYGLAATGRGMYRSAYVSEEIGRGEPDTAAGPDDERRLPREGRVLHYCPNPARKTLICAEGPCTNSANASGPSSSRSEEHTSELQSRQYLVCRLLLE